MDVFSTSLLIFAVLFVAAIVAGGLIAFLQHRHALRDRQQMKKHVQNVVAGGGG